MCAQLGNAKINWICNHFEFWLQYLSGQVFCYQICYICGFCSYFWPRFWFVGLQLYTLSVQAHMPNIFSGGGMCVFERRGGQTAVQVICCLWNWSPAPRAAWEAFESCMRSINTCLLLSSVTCPLPLCSLLLITPLKTTQSLRVQSGAVLAGCWGGRVSGRVKQFIWACSLTRGAT